MAITINAYLVYLSYCLCFNGCLPFDDEQFKFIASQFMY